MCLWIPALSVPGLLTDILGSIIAEVLIGALGEESSPVPQSLQLWGSGCSSGTKEEESWCWRAFRAGSVPHELLGSLLLLSQSWIVDLCLGFLWFCRVAVFHKSCDAVGEQGVAVLPPHLSLFLSYLGVRLDTQLA